MAVDLSDDEKEGTFDMMDASVSDPPNMLHEERGNCYPFDPSLYSDGLAATPLYEGSHSTVLQALQQYFTWFSEHPGTSKDLSILAQARMHCQPCYQCSITISCLWETFSLIPMRLH